MENGRNCSPLSTLFYYMMLDFYVKTGIRFSLRDKRLFEITEVKIVRVDCNYHSCPKNGADAVANSVDTDQTAPTAVFG